MSLTFRRAKMGGGGYSNGIDISPDGLTRVSRTDVYGCYIWNSTTDKWDQLFTGTSMPVAFRTLGMFGDALGCYEIRVAPNDSNYIYAVTPATAGAASTTTVIKSTDRGATWTITNLTPSLMSMQAEGKNDGPKMAIDPTDKNHVIVGNSAGEFYRTTDGGANWALVTSPTGSYPAVQFDLNNSDNVYITWGTGSNRVYRSTNNGASFSQMTGGPNNIWRIASAIDGTIYMTDRSGSGDNAWKLSGTTFTQLSATFGSGWHTVACDPTDANRVTLGYSAGNINTSLDAGATWGGAYANAPIRDATGDVTWLAWTNEDSMSSGQMVYDPIVAGKLWYAEGIGVWYTTPPTDNARPTWYAQTRGIETLISNKVIFPPGGVPHIACQDRAIFRITNPEAYPSTHGPAAGVGAVQIQHCWGIDYSTSDNTFLVATIGGGYGDSYSTDGGVTWTAFSTQPTNGTTGSIVAASPTSIVIFPNADNDPQYTTDGGATWNLCSFPVDVPTTGTQGWGHSVYLNNKYLAVDRVTGYYYAINYVTKHFYKSTDGGANFTEVAQDVLIGVGTSAEIATVPGKSGHIFFTGGTSGAPHPNNLGLKRSTNAGSDWSAVSGITECWALGFGKEQPGGSYPTILMAGMANGDSLPGIYLSTDECSTWVLQTNAPANSLDTPRSIAGDMNTVNRFYIGLSASGALYTPGSTPGKAFGLQF